MRKLMLLAIAGACVLGCTRGGDEPAMTNGVSTDSSESPDSRRAVEAQTQMSGERAYEIACANCHDSATSGAPLTGDQNVWKYRSPMWESVLAEHANEGYLDMPAKGGTTELTDQDVIRAVEYMMLLTYPERLPDD